MALKEEKKKDRRVKYTLMVIRESFIQLLKQKPISKITIKEICEEADINRATFYAHYLDQYDLLSQIENDVIDDINQYLSSYDFKNIAEAPYEMLEKILEYIKENAGLFELLLLNANADIKFRKRITEIIGQQHFLAITPDKKDSEYVYLFFANCAIGVILKWIEGSVKKPVNEIANLILRLSRNGSEYFLNH